MKRLTGILAMLLALCLAFAALGEGFDTSSYTQEELDAIAAQIEAHNAEQAKQYAIEHGNRAITFAEEGYTLPEGGKLTLEPTVTALTDDAPAKTKLAWSSSDDKVAKVNAKGVVTAVAEGEATVTCTATDDGNIFGTVLVRVTAIVRAVTLDTTEATLLLGADEASARCALTATVEPANAVNRAVTWTSSNEAVATVDENGNVQAIAAGKATVTVASVEAPKCKASCKLTVGQAVTGITIEPAEVKLLADKKATVKATVLPKNAGNKTVVWSSADESIATVNEKGQVTAIARGETEIVCTSADGSGATATAKVWVQQPVTTITLGYKTTVQTTVGSTLSIPYLCEPADASDPSVVWSSSDERIAKVDQKGVVTAVKYGKCTISCTAQDAGKAKATLSLTVEPRYAAELAGVKVGHNSIGSPEVYVKVKNLSREKNIIAFRFATKCYNAYGTLLEAHGFGDATEYWIWQEGSIKPGKTWGFSNWRWTLYGFDTAYSIDVWLTDYRTDDGTITDIPYDASNVWTWTR